MKINLSEAFSMLEYTYDYKLARHEKEKYHHISTENHSSNTVSVRFDSQSTE